MFLAAVALAPGTVTGQSFEVASVKTTPGPWRESKTFDDRVDFPYTTLRSCVAFAYRLKEYQVSGPAWIGELHYEILAKGPAGTTRDQLPEMMQKLLADRFKLEVRREKKDFNVYALVVGKNGPKLKESPKDTDALPGASFGISMGPSAVGRIEAKRADMTALANTLPRFVGRPVVDQTGIEGRYDFELEFSPDDMKALGVPPPPESASHAAAELGVSLFTSVQRLGLRLESQKVSLDAIVVERAERTPSEN
jgi:uncharacterized protein (TIGR03435 family)